MVTRIINPKRYPGVVSALQRHGCKDPLQDYYVVSIRVEDAAYRLSLHLGKRHGLTALQAVKLQGNRPLELITRSALLLALMELWLASAKEETP